MRQFNPLAGAHVFYWSLLFPLASRHARPASRQLTSIDGALLISVFSAFPIIIIIVIIFSAFSSSIPPLGSQRLVNSYPYATYFYAFVCILLSLPLTVAIDWRWVYTLWHGPSSLGYDWWALWAVVQVQAGHSDLLDATGTLSTRGFEATARLRMRDFICALVLLALIAAVVLPLGLGIGFVRFGIPKGTTVWDVLSNAVENLLTVALVSSLSLSLSP